MVRKCGFVMADLPGTQPDDETLAFQLMERDEEALRTIIRVYGPSLKGYLGKRFGDVLDELELDEAFVATIEKVWRYPTFDDRNGSLAGWLIRIARNCAISILNCENKHHCSELKCDPEYDPAEAPALTCEDRDDRDEDPKKDAKLLKDLDEAVRGLPRLQRAIIEADLATPNGKADSGRLADKYGSTKNSVEVSRTKARAQIRQELLRRGHFQNQRRAK